MKITITEFEVNRDSIETTCAFSSRPDPNWFHTGRDGTVYRWVLVGKDWALPGLVKKTQTHITTDVCYECGHEHEVTKEETWLETPDGERVVPGYAHDTNRTFVPGQMTLSGRGVIVLDEGEFIPAGLRFDLEDAILSRHPGDRLHGRGIITSVYYATGEFAFVADGDFQYITGGEGSVPE